MGNFVSLGSFLAMIATIFIVGLVLILYPGFWWVLSHIIESLIIVLVAGVLAMVGWQKFVANKKKRK